MVTWAWRTAPSSYSGPGWRRGSWRTAGRGSRRRASPVLRRGQRGPAGLGRGVDDREVQHVGLGVLEQVEEQLVRLLDDLGDPGVGAVDLVDHHDDRQVLGQRLAQHEPGLRQRALGGVDQQQHAVDHLQAALHLAAEVGVAGGVDDVDDHVVTVGRVVQHGGVLREDGDALLALQVHRVHHAVVDVLVGAERAGLPQHGVDEGGLAVVDVGHDGDVAQIGTYGHEQLFPGITAGGQPDESSRGWPSATREPRTRTPSHPYTGCKAHRAEPAGGARCGRRGPSRPVRVAAGPDFGPSVPWR